MLLVRTMLAAVMLLALAASAGAAARVALVVGNAGYAHIAELANPKNDAELIAGTLEGLGFTLIGGGPQIDLDKSGFDRAVRDFGREAIGADVALFYFAGHGIQLRGSNFLVPVDANPTREADVDFEMVDSRIVLRQMAGAGSKLNLIILDACRNNPFAGRGLRSASSGLAQMQAPEGTLISFATQPGNVALDGTGANSPYTQALANAMQRPGLSIFRLFNEVGLTVSTDTGGQQQPWVSLSPIKGDFYFKPSGGDTPAAQGGALAALQARLQELEARLSGAIGQGGTQGGTQDGTQAQQLAALPPATEPEEEIADQPAAASVSEDWRVQVQDAHALSIESVAVTPDRKIAVTSASDEKIKIWDMETGRLIRTLQGHTDDINAVDISTDGRHIVSGSDDDTARVWDLVTGEELRRFEGDDFRSVRFSPDGKYLALGETELVTLYDARTYEPVTTFRGHDEYTMISVLRFSADSSRLASGGADEKVLVYSIPEFRTHATIPVGAEQDDLVFLDRSDQMVIGTEEGVSLWKVGESYSRSQAEVEYGVDSIEYDRASRTILTASDVGTLYRFDRDLSGGREIGDSYEFNIEPGADRLLISTGRQIELVDVTNPDDISVIRKFGYEVQHTHVITPLLGDNQRVLKTDYDGVVAVDLLSGDITKRYVSGETTDISREIVAQSQGGRWIASHWSSEYDVWDIDGTFIGAYEDYDSIPDTIDISPDGRFVLAGGYDEAMMRRLSAGSGTSVHKGEEDVELLRFLPSGDRFIIALEGGTLQIRKTADRAVETEIDLPGDRSYTHHYDAGNGLVYSINSSTYHDDGGYVRDFHVFDAETLEYLSGRKFSATTDDRWAYAMLPMPEFGKLVTGHGDGIVRVWEMSTGALTHEMVGHGGLVSSIVHPGGNIVVTAADDGLRMWDVAAGRLVARYKFFRNGDSIMIDENGNFSGTNSAPQYVALARGLDNKPLDPATMNEKFTESELLDASIFEAESDSRSFGSGTFREAVVQQIANRSADYLEVEQIERNGDLDTALARYFELARSGDADALVRLLDNSDAVSADAGEFVDIVGRALRSGNFRVLMQVKQGIGGWSPALRSAMQNLLKSAGQYDGPIDGIFGPKSLAAIDSYAELD